MSILNPLSFHHLAPSSFSAAIYSDELAWKFYELTLKSRVESFLENEKTISSLISSVDQIKNDMAALKSVHDKLGVYNGEATAIGAAWFDTVVKWQKEWPAIRGCQIPNVVFNQLTSQIALTRKKIRHYLSQVEPAQKPYQKLRKQKS